MSGNNPFAFDQNEIYLKLSPILPNWLFDDHDCVSYTIFGTTEVVYRNPSRKNLFPGEYDTIKNLKLHNDSIVVHQQDNLKVMEPWVTMIRKNEIAKIEVTF